MPSIRYGLSAYKRDDGNFPPIELINMYVEKSDTSEGGFALISRPGLGQLASIGSGPIVGIFSREGVLSGDVFSVSGTALYRGTSAITSGTIAGSALSKISMAGSASELVIARSSTPRSYNGTNIADISFPDSASVTAFEFIGGLFVAARSSTHKFYWSDVLDGRTWDPLNFASAEREADVLLDLKAVGDNLWLFGSSSIEVWAHTGDADAPFTRFEQVTYDTGIKATGCVVNADNALFWISNKNYVYRSGEVPIRISTHWIEAEIRDAGLHSMFTWTWDGHEFVAVQTPGQTWVYDIATEQWSEFQSSQSNWLPGCSAMQGDVVYFGHFSTGQLMGFDEWDDLGVEMERRFTAAQQLDEPTSIDSVRLWANSGQTPLLTGQGSEPVIEMRVSDDAGNTWSNYEEGDLGAQGQYRALAEWRALGMFDFPGLLMEFRCTDPVPLRISAVKANYLGGGRSI